MRVALVNPRWSFEGSIYFGCREPHLPLELGYAKAMLERAGHDDAACWTATCSTAAQRATWQREVARVRRRHDGGDDGAELPVLALRAAGAARAGEHSCGRSARRGGRTVAVGTAWLGDPWRDAAQARRRRRGARRVRGRDRRRSPRRIDWSRVALDRLSRTTAAYRVQRSRPPRTAFVDLPPRSHGPTSGSPGTRTITIASTSRSTVPAPRWRHRAAAHTTAASAPRTTIATPIAAGTCRWCCEEIDRLIDAGRRLRLLHRRDLPAAARRCSRRWRSARSSSACRRASTCGSRPARRCSAAPDASRSRPASRA